MPDDPNYLLAQTGESQWGWPWIWSGSEWHGTGNRPSSGVQLCFARPIEKVDPRDYRQFSYPEPGPQMPVKVKNQNGKGACFPAGTRIRLADGSTKPIEDIRILDRVLTAEGNTKRVTRTYVTPDDKRDDPFLYCISVDDHRPLWATGNHPILTRLGSTENYVVARNLKRGNLVVMPSYAPEKYEHTLSPTLGDNVGRTVRRLSGVVPEKIKGDVFNLEVEDDHSYVAEGIGVHNCNGHAAATTLEMARWVAGMTSVDLSAWFVYAILCNGVDQGSSIDDALDLLTKTGTCPETDVPYGTINPRSLTDQARRDAARYKIEIGTKLVTWDDLMSATMLGRPFNFSICVGSNFNSLDSNGVVGYSSGYGNHAVSGGWGAKEIGGGEWAIRWQNSWGPTWGLRGFAYFTRKHWENQQYATAYDLVAVTDDPQDPEPFPVPRMAYELPGVETPCSTKSTFYLPRTSNV